MCEETDEGGVRLLGDRGSEEVQGTVPGRMCVIGMEPVDRRWSGRGWCAGTSLARRAICYSRSGRSGWGGGRCGLEVEGSVKSRGYLVVAGLVRLRGEWEL